MRQFLKANVKLYVDWDTNSYYYSNTGLKEVKVILKCRHSEDSAATQISRAVSCAKLRSLLLRHVMYIMEEIAAFTQQEGYFITLKSFLTERCHNRQNIIVAIPFGPMHQTSGSHILQQYQK